MTKAERAEIRDEIDMVKSEIEDIDADWVGLGEELRDIQERIAAAKAAKSQLRLRLSELRTALNPRAIGS